MSKVYSFPSSKYLEEQESNRLLKLVIHDVEGEPELSSKSFIDQLFDSDFEKTVRKSLKWKPTELK